MKLGDVWLEKEFESDAFCIVSLANNFVVGQLVMVGDDISPLPCRRFDTTVIDPDYLKKHYKPYTRLSFKNFLRVKHG
jgi:hypothetical protein